MATRVRMPPLGQTSDEIQIVTWRKAVGDDVVEGEVLLDVETDKAILEVEASAGGVLLAVLHDAGAVVTSGELIAWIGAAGEEIPAEPDPPAPATAPVVNAPGPREVPASNQSAGALAAPATRALAREHGVDIEQIQGSGPGGRIERADVLAAVEQRRAAGPPTG